MTSPAGSLDVQGWRIPLDRSILDEAYRRFPDEIEPVDYHPVGKIVVDRGHLRFAFYEGAMFARKTAPPEER